MNDGRSPVGRAASGIGQRMTDARLMQCIGSST